MPKRIDDDEETDPVLKRYDVTYDPKDDTIRYGSRTGKYVESYPPVRETVNRSYVEEYKPTLNDIISVLPRKAVTGVGVFLTVLGALIIGGSLLALYLMWGA